MALKNDIRNHRAEQMGGTFAAQAGRHPCALPSHLSKSASTNTPACAPSHNILSHQRAADRSSIWSLSSLSARLGKHVHVHVFGTSQISHVHVFGLGNPRLSQTAGKITCRGLSRGSTFTPCIPCMSCMSCMHTWGISPNLVGLVYTIYLGS